MSSSRDDVTRPGWSRDEVERVNQTVNSTELLDVSVRPRSSSCCQAQKRPAQLATNLDGDRTAYTHKREGLYSDVPRYN